MRSRTDRDAGFSIVELVVVMTIISVLVAIAIPTVIGFRRAAQDRAAQTDLRNALLAEKTYVLENDEVYTGVGGDLTAYQTGAPFAADPADGVYLDLNDADATIVCMVRDSEGGSTFSIWEHPISGTFYGATDLSVADCPGVPPVGYRTDGF
jgi:prepilin-type N-terminal cleavage/methylation domain-containing protein